MLPRSGPGVNLLNHYKELPAFQLESRVQISYAARAGPRALRAVRNHVIGVLDDIQVGAFVREPLSPDQMKECLTTAENSSAASPDGKQFVAASGWA